MAAQHVCEHVQTNQRRNGRRKCATMLIPATAHPATAPATTMVRSTGRNVAETLTRLVARTLRASTKTPIAARRATAPYGKLTGPAPEAATAASAATATAAAPRDASLRCIKHASISTKGL